jgi:hypothetical protein
VASQRTDSIISMEFSLVFESSCRIASWVGFVGWGTRKMLVDFLGSAWFLLASLVLSIPSVPACQLLEKHRNKSLASCQDHLGYGGY